MNISLPESMKKYVEARTEEGDYSTVSEYLRELIRNDRDKQSLRALILEGLESPVIEEDAHDFVKDLQASIEKSE